ncbi:MAG: OmpH family outer membrane protein [Candidatus Loosdrechtia sp.]|uniref:OmpH family outer membrane protein n=1 Tax=Candidatus Loosdrechtia sp. TaxID=3101272 RepID=UPI003A6257C9|nr:MAG: OmpH family outer membrane protein [Candidatus Jettenia sp. AMX2]
MKLEILFHTGIRLIKKFIIITSFACLSLFLLLDIQARSQDAVASRTMKIGVVDLNRVFEKYEKRKNLDAQLKDQEREYQKILNDKRKELANLNEKIQLLDLGSEARRRNEEAFEKKNIELESYARFAENNLVRRYRDYFESLYLEVCREVEDIGKREGYDLILKKEEPDLQGGGITELQFKVGIKTVLYNSEGIDITSQVVESLNKKYAGKGK